MLFNIKTIVTSQKAEVRFPFDKYKKEKWDIEHVNSQTDKIAATPNASHKLVAAGSGCGYSC